MFPLVPTSTKIACAISLCFALYGVLASYLYLGSLKDLSSLQEQHKSLQTQFDEQVESKRKLEESVAQDEKHSKDLGDKITELDKEQKPLQEKVAAIPSNRCPKQQGVTNVKEDNVADIDDKLPSELVVLLQQSDSQNSGSSSSTSR